MRIKMLQNISRLSWAWIIFVLLSSTFMRQLFNLAATLTSRTTITYLLWLLFLVIGLAITYLLYYQLRKPLLGSAHNARQYSVSLLSTFLAGLTLAYFLEIPEERIHLIKYGLIGALVYRDLNSRIVTILFGIGIACLDEFFQYLLPYRVGDLRDVLIDTLGIIWGMLLAMYAGKLRLQFK